MTIKQTLDMKSPVPVFDDLNHIDEVDLKVALSKSENCTVIINDYTHALNFLKSYNGSVGTFNSYRREIERFLAWSRLASHKTLIELKREDIEEFMKFCLKPPKSWIGTSQVPRFITKEGMRIPNPLWRPFVASVSKAERSRGKCPEVKEYTFKQSGLLDTFRILGSFYNYLLQEEYLHVNPVALIRQRSKFIQKSQALPVVRRLSELQWHYLYSEATKMAEEEPEVHERTLFILSCLYSMYLRISELAASTRWTPLMNHFYKDSEDNWWFITLGKGNKKRQIAVSDAMLEALVRYRKHLKLSLLPSPSDNSPLIPKTKGSGAITSTFRIRNIVQCAFDRAIRSLNEEGFTLDAESLKEATVHWLRHTGISEDVKHRPREHVRDDAGHGSGAITDRYIDVELRARHRSARDKVIEG